ncbi:hypothetical protein FBEOM_2936 [Fusarium beomiforme]|uniref:DUF676 domain-containing protein n=1 Tax=Fusarium beomiforme TaxID=44412 RepID=A0A9P5AR13_9HYPO|nr:hypothetical protein FBEOM_2936 [Fusarium beomiforme]
MSIVVVFEPPNASVDIVFVNGWSANGQPWTTGSKETAACWPKSILPNLLPQARIILFQYEANVEDFWAVSSKNEIDSYAQDLLGGVVDLRTKTKTNDRLVIFVAHSIGGIVCERAIVRAQTGSPGQQEFVKHVKRIAFMGTPFHTNKMKWTETGKVFFQLAGCNAPLDDDLSKSEKLTEFCDRFLDFTKAKKDIEIAIFYERRETELGGTDVILAGEEAVKIPGCPDPSGLKATHQGLAEVASQKDDHFKRGLLRQLSSWVNQATEAKADDAKKGQYNISFDGKNYGLQIGNNPGRVEGVDIRNKETES